MENFFVLFLLLFCVCNYIKLKLPEKHTQTSRLKTDKFTIEWEKMEKEHQKKYEQRKKDTQSLVKKKAKQQYRGQYNQNMVLWKD